jgi:TonB family protein
LPDRDQVVRPPQNFIKHPRIQFATLLVSGIQVLTMAVSWSTPELAARFSKYVEELRDFLATSSMHYGSADDLAAVAIRIDAVPSFRDDLASLVRAIILREGGVVPRTNLLEILAIAIGGSEFDQAGREIQQPLGCILDFVNSVIAKPWNEPPGESRLRPESSSSPVRKMPAPVRREESPATAQEQTPSPDPQGTPMEGYGAMLAARHKVVPISSRRPTESRRPAPAPTPTDWLMAAGGTLTPPAALGEGTFSRLNHVERQTDTRPGPNPGPVPNPVPNPIPPPPQPPAEAVLAQSPAPAPTIAPSPRVPFLSSSSPQPSAQTPEGIAAKEASPANSSLPKFSLPKLPQFKLPKLTIPNLPLRKLSLPKFSLPRLSLPRSSTVKPERPAFSFPKLPPVVLFGATFAGGCLIAFATVWIFGFHRPSETQATARLLPPAPRAAAPTAPAAANLPAANPSLPPEPTATSPSKPSAYGSSRYDDYIAPPYSRPIAGQTAPAQASTAPITSASSAPSQTYAGDLHPASYSAPAPIVRQPRTVDPDSTYVGATAAEREADTVDSSLPPPARRRYPTVASSVMRSNLLAAPAPGYPLLAKIAHIEGPVVVEAVVAPDGTVSDARVLSGHRLLRGAAVEAVRQWRYRPYLINGRPAEVSTTVTLDFPGAANQAAGKSVSRPLATPHQPTEALTR